jgi:hypothetical protein
MHIDTESPFAQYRIREVLQQKASGICTDCGLEDADATRFDGMYCTSCANYAETTIS